MAGRILVIEDNQTNLDLISYLLGAFGFEVLTALDGRSGYETACRVVPDLIICDIQMPEIDGYAVARMVRATAALQRTPLVAVTALAMVDDRRKVLEGGFDGYISKPIDPETFIRQVEAFLPAAKSPRPQPVAEPATRPAPERPPEPAPANPDGRPTILVVDDVPGNIAFARSLLEPSGYRVIAADNGENGLALARESSPDLILSDLDMPGGDGFQLLRAVRRDPRLRQTPLAVLSCTFWNDQDRRRAMTEGADRFLVRPMDPHRFLDEIATLIAGRRVAP